MLSKKDIDFLRHFKSASHPVISLYLNTDGKFSSKKEVETRLKEMGRLARLRINNNGGKEYRKVALDEIQKVEDYVIRNFKEFNFRGLALFSCTPQNLWHEIVLPRPPRNRFTLSDTPFIRPLQFQEMEYHRFCTALVDKNNARIFLIYQGTILEYRQVADDVPAKVRWGGWSGYGEKRTARKLEHKINEHFHHVASTLFELYKRDQFHWLIVGCKSEYLKEFESTLHAYLRERLVAHLDMTIDTPEHEVLERSIRVEKGILFRDHCKEVDRLIHLTQSGGLAVTGLEATLHHLDAQAVDTLLVSRDFSTGGVRCNKCGYLGILEKECPYCAIELEDSPDVITDIIDKALAANCSVKQVYEGVGMDTIGNIGALLRFKL